ncbi:MAG: glycosyl hydrolase family 28 protein [Gaiellaceae bacterium]
MRRAHKLAVSLAAGVAALSGPSAQTAAAQLVTYPAPSGQPQNSEYSVKVREPGASWHKLDEYLVTVGLDTKSESTLAMFDADGPVAVSITKKGGTIGSARVRPRGLAIRPKISADRKTATFTLPRPLKVSFEVDGDRQHNVQLFANPIERNLPRAGARRLIYYGPGIHTLPGDHIREIPSNTTVYLAGGAVVRGSLQIHNAHDIVIRGRGILALPAGSGPSAAILLTHASRVGIRDITVIAAHATGIDIYKSRQVTIANLKEINSDRWADGIDVECSSGVLVDDSFLRSSDDSVAVYASRWGYVGNTRDVSVRNTSLWADVAHAVLIGTHADPSRSDLIEQIAFQNIDILEHNEDVDIYQGAMAVNAGDNVWVRDIRFDQIRVDNFSLGQLVNVKVFLNPDYNKKPGRRVSNVFFRAVSYRGSGAHTSQIAGYDSSHFVSNVVFENLVENGRTIFGATAGDIAVGSDVRGLVFRRQPQTVIRNDGDRKTIGYRGRWTARRMAGFQKGDGHFARKAGSRMSFAFHTRQARIYGLTSPASGRARVFVDGRLSAEIDTYSSSRRPRQILFDTGVLAPGKHRVELRVTGAKSILSSASTIALDSVEIVS